MHAPTSSGRWRSFKRHQVAYRAGPGQNTRVNPLRWPGVLLAIVAFPCASTACGNDADAQGQGGAGLAAGGGGLGGLGGVGGIANTFSPAELVDDKEPYAFAELCEDLPQWQLPTEVHPNRVAAVSAVEAYVVAFNELFHLLPNGMVEKEPLVGVIDAWRCPGVTWAVGAAGLVARKPDDAAWETLDAGFESSVPDGGVGCDGDVWIGGDYEVRVFDGTSWRVIATQPTVLTSGTVIEHDVARVRGAGSFRAATSNYGATMAYFPEEDLFIPVGGTDALVSDAVQFRDGSGSTLYYGYALKFDREIDASDGDSPLAGVRASRRADDDIWITRDELVAHFDGRELVDEALPKGLTAEDVDARFDSVWTAGYGGLTVRTANGFCVVASTFPVP